MKKTLSAPSLNPRKQPGQSRSVETVCVILEAAARVLEERGFDGYTTNAIADRAGVSIGSLYQYFPNKDALTLALIERETAPMLAEARAISKGEGFRYGAERMVRSAVRHQMLRPKLARLIDFEEQRLPVQTQVANVSAVLQATVMELLSRKGAPTIENCAIAAADTVAIVKGIVDGAGAREERDAKGLEKRVLQAVFGYLGYRQ